MPAPVAKAPIVLTWDSMMNATIEKAVKEQMEKAAKKTILGEGMKTAGLGDIQKLLQSFGITPSVIEKGVTMLFDYLQAQNAAKGFGPPPPSGGFGPAPVREPPFQPTPPASPPPQAPRASAQGPTQRTRADAEATFNLHVALLKHMINTWGNILIADATQKFIESKAQILASYPAPDETKAETAPPAAEVPGQGAEVPGV